MLRSYIPETYFIAELPKIDYDSRLKSPQMVRVGHSLIIPINYVSEPAAKVEWFCNDKLLTDTTLGVSLDGVDTFSTLTIKKVASNNSGQYMVKLTNKAGSATAKFDFSVTGKISLIPHFL